MIRTTMFSQTVANSIAAIAIVVIPFAVLGRWPVWELLLCSSIGGALSPIVWRGYRAVRQRLSGRAKTVMPNHDRHTLGTLTATGQLA